MEIAIRKEPNGIIYIDKNLRSDIPYTEPPYNFKIIEVEKEDCEAEDFNDDLTFSLEKYNARKQKELDKIRIVEIETRMDALDKDFRQADLGAVIEDLGERKAEFIALHNEWRTLQGKPLRVYE
jgi:hypothetical protein